MNFENSILMKMSFEFAIYLNYLPLIKNSSQGRIILADGFISDNAYLMAFARPFYAAAYMNVLPFQDFVEMIWACADICFWHFDDTTFTNIE